ncbi:MAG: transposase [Planctomycetota bacterium]
MTRPLHEDWPNAVFHVTARVNWRFWHLENAHNARIFLQELADSAKLFGIDILAFVLMSNHYHIVVRSPEPRQFRELSTRRCGYRHRRPYPSGHPCASVLSRFMRRVMQQTSRRIHAEMGLSGHFWEARFDRRHIRDSTSLIVRIAYDHLNPVREKMVTRPEQFPRSSAAWWAADIKPAIELLKRPLPFALERDEFRRRLLRCQDSRAFVDSVRAVRADGLSPRSEEGVTLLLEILRELGSEHGGCGT